MDLQSYIWEKTEWNEILVQIYKEFFALFSLKFLLYSKGKILNCFV